MSSATRYHSFSQFLHWAIAGLIVLQFILANLVEGAADSGSALRELALLANHKSVGITVLALVIVRLMWRVKKPPPALPATMDQWQILASHISHWALYGLIILIPVSGWLMSSASAYSVSWFNLFQLPDFVAPDPGLKELLKETHELLGKLLFVVAVVHILAAFKHQLIDKDGVMARMSAPLWVGVFALIIAGGTWSLGGAGGDSTVTVAISTTTATASEDAGAAVISELPVWQIDYQSSYIRFTGDQAGADFDGVWQSWSAEMRFDGDNLGSSSFDVTIRTADVETQDDDRDTTLADPEWFDVTKFPEAYYRASKFAELPDGNYAAHGQLLIKGMAAPATLTFTLESNGAQRVLVGSADLLRLDHGVGTGEWEDTTWVSNEVRINVKVVATVND
ncbi:MAG: cytochrome b/b6 domain-containing protein [Proteobacteria bacterium]|nr:cytochrome b/b6 domain-containing protein [Pseudomonadota bacterium]